MSGRKPGPIWLVAFSSLVGCSTWTSVHGGYGHVFGAGHGEGSIGVSRAIGGTRIESPLGLTGVHARGGGDRFEGDIHVGVIRPVHLGRQVTLAPSVGVELATVMSVDGAWQGGALGFRSGVEVAWWLWADRELRRTDRGCMGGVEGVDCARCIATRVTLDGLNVQAIAEGPPLVGPAAERLQGWGLWLMLGVTHAVSAQEGERCNFGSRRRNGSEPWRRDSRLQK